MTRRPRYWAVSGGHVAGLRPVLLQRDELVFGLAIALSLVHAVYQAVVERGDEEVRQAVALAAVSVALVLVYRGLGALGRGRMALALGLVGVVVATATHALEIVREGLDLARSLAAFTVLGSVLLVVLGATMLGARSRAVQRRQPRLRL